MTVAAESVIEAPAATAYGIIADYRNGHPRIVPPAYFQDLTVERGGVGAGTLIRFRARAFGLSRTLRAEVTEPDPGRVLVETDPDTGVRTTFTVTPRDGDRRAHVVIATELPARGLRGWLEAVMARPLLRKVYAQELERLATVAAESPAARAESRS